ncbi:MAG: hypothetical protein K2Q26_04655 [Bdellovibrionales bacterium]|nr:hypothetical protein [Bdellovibrionales bacterium]
MKSLFGALFLVIVVSPNAFAGGIYCEATCVVTENYGTWINGLPQISQALQVSASSPGDLVRKCTTSDKSIHTRLVRSYRYLDIGSYNALNGQAIVYLYDFVPATEANSCKDASLAPLKQ